MRPAVVLALLLAVPLLAGCVAPGASVPAGSVSDQLSQPVPDLKVLKEQTPVAMKDGVKLDNWVFRPDAPGKFPVILQSRPYFGNLDPPAADGGQKFSKWLVDYFVPRGYVVVLHSIRGTGDSGGCYDQGGVQEQVDEAANVEAFAGKDYSNGKVALIGKSYGGTTPWEAAVQKPPHLATIVPIEGITRWYDYLWTNGAYYNNQGDFNAAYTGTISYNAGTGTPPPSLTQLQNYPGKACQRQADMQQAGAESAATGDETAWWQERNFKRSISKINEAGISVYFVHGLQDWNVKPDAILGVYNELTVPKRLLLGQQDHQYPLRADWGEDLLRWFDHFLKGIDTGILQTKPVMVSDADGAWRLEDSWPPLRAAPTMLAVKGGSFAESPASKVADGAPGPDRVVWTSEALTAPLRVAGAPHLALNATFSCAAGQVAMTLFLVNETGWNPLSWAAADARHHKGADKPETFAPGATLGFSLDFQPIDKLVPAGAKLAMVTAGANAFVQTGAPCAQVALADGALALPAIEAEPMLESPQPEMKKPIDLPWTS